MPRIDIGSCEPFRAWNRLEPRPRHAEFDKVLECGVHDALWMLTRQWQFGEFQGEDTGSAIFSKIQMVTTSITRCKTANGNAVIFDDTIPLEEKIESIPFKTDYKSKLDAAYMFLSCMDTIAADKGTAGYNRNTYKKRLITLFPLHPADTITNADNYQTIINKAKILSNTSLVNITNAAATRYFDGEQLFIKLTTDNAVTQLSVLNGVAAHASLVADACIEFINWYKTNFNVAAPIGTSWQPSHLEYQFECALPAEDTTNTVLSADQYSSGNLDWYSFDVNNNESFAGLTGAASAEEMTGVKTELITAMPVEAKFAGAPNSRWWQFENGQVDMGNFNAHTTDLAKLVFAEYALLYNTDWLIVPHQVPAGSFCDIKGIVVTDVFGQQFFVESANQGLTDNWAGWGMYNLSKINAEGVRHLPVDTRLLVTPNVIKNQKSNPIEEIHFLRDEMTNSVWAVETRLPDQLGAGMDGFNYARAFADTLKTIDTTPQQDDAIAEAMFKYTLSNIVPENWIPFIPIHTGDKNRAIKLQRASMPRLLNNAYHHTRPNSQLLRFGLDDTDDDKQTLPYFINEEEVPRAGVQLTATFQRTRWYNGKTVDWYGYRKKTGRGEGSSGLYYDKLEAIKK